MDDKELEKRIYDRVKKKLKVDVEKVDFARYRKDGDDILRAEVLLKKTAGAMSDDMFYYLIPLVAEVIDGSGERGYPLVMPQLSKGQKVKVTP